MQLKEISFEIIQRCPNNCVYCSSNSNCHSKYIINLEVFKKTIDDAIKLGLERLCISGGEPFLHSDIVDMIKYSKERNLEVFVYTSGVIKYPDNKFGFISKDILQKVKQAGLDRLIFNVQSSEEELYDKIMGTTSCFNLMKTSIKTSAEIGIFCEIHFVPMRLNYKMIYSVLDMAKNLGVKKVSFLRLVVQGRALQNRKIVDLTYEMTTELKSILSTLKENYQGIEIRLGIPLSHNNTYSCNASVSKLIIRYDGAVFPCEAFKYLNVISGESDITPNNINICTLTDIYYNSEFLRILRSEIGQFKAKAMSCETCPAQWKLANI